MDENIDSDPGFRFTFSPTQHNIADFPSSSSHVVNSDPNNSKKRSKLIKIDDGQFPTCSSIVSRPKYTKKPDPAAPKITRPCSECGRKFWSWKALFGHMRCHPERQWRGINPPPNHRRPVSPVTQKNNVEALITEEDHEIAASLLMLANGTAASESECDTNCQLGVQENDAFGANLDANFRFECSSCKKVFESHQALGGHRASHKNVRGCFAVTRSEGYEVEDQSGYNDGLVKQNVEDNSKLMMVLGHKCSICLRVFSSGQALGGHKRCHWERGYETSLNQGLNLLATRQNCGLDLNLPAPVENDSSSFSSGLALDLRLGL
ncbi:zinc finger protein ZAT3-like [Durio zibethinus]|uniref:Zinc finger protein ZAT3-like n=1 Tax=Durio zibethinus TaxID=66656 RepID=A0A6P5XGE7_DURZI|nr:zinc finger protein ZAT3-like [Durio zibethinus]